MRKINSIITILSLLFIPSVASANDEGTGIFMNKLLVRDISGAEVPLATFEGKVLLIVNTASKCGYTGQLGDLENVYKQFHERGFEVLGFPSNDFGGQEPGSESEIKAFCTGTYGVTFPLFSKIAVVGPQISPLFRHLTESAPETGEVKWNFEKFLVNRKGKVVARFRSKVVPTDPSVLGAIEKEL